jgi:prepilin-type N-terminal cleavage/methylation domain-containing protein
MKKIKKQKGFTLIEILVVIGIIAILAAVVLIAINPARQFAQARNSQRVSNVNAILNAVGQDMADNKGIFTCSGSAYTIASTSTVIKNGATGADLAPCIIPTYISSMPFDPKNALAKYTDNTDYDTEYTIMQDSTTGRITICAPDSTEPGILNATVICVTR